MKEVLTRRRLLALSGAVGAAALAGCGDGGPGDEEEPPGEEEEEPPGEEEEPPAEEEEEVPAEEEENETDEANETDEENES